MLNYYYSGCCIIGGNVWFSFKANLSICFSKAHNFSSIRETTTLFVKQLIFIDVYYKTMRFKEKNLLRGQVILDNQGKSNRSQFLWKFLRELCEPSHILGSDKTTKINKEKHIFTWNSLLYLVGYSQSQLIHLFLLSHMISWCL